jgi:hypothetical protein
MRARFAPVRGLAVSVVVALAICGAALGVGWAAQARVLPRSPRASHVAADAASWLLRHRVVEASFRVDGGRSERSLCLHSWFPRTDGTVARGALVLLGSGRRIADNGGSVRVAGFRGARPEYLPLLLELAGCPSVLGARAATAATDGGIEIARAFAAGRPVLTLRLPAESDRIGPRTRVADRVTLYVAVRTYRPLAVSVSLGTIRGVARIRALRATPGLLARFVAPNTGTPGTQP